MTSTAKTTNQEEDRPTPTLLILEKVDVVIIGAGFAGLSAARHFQDHHPTISFRVLEGRHEVGGRCRTIALKDGTSVAELGAQWIHNSTDANPVSQLVKASGVQAAICQRYSGCVYHRHNNNDDDTNGTKKFQQVSRKEYLEKRKQLLDPLLEFLEKQQEKEGADVDLSLQDGVHQFLGKRKTGFLRSKKKHTEEDRAWLAYFLDSEVVQEYAASLEDLSLVYWDSDDIDDSGDHIDLHLGQDVGGGYQGVLDYFAAPVLDQLLLNCKVTTIDWSESDDNCVSVQYESSEGSEEHNNTVVARRVLVTVPLGVLKAKIIQFIPDLPDHKQKIIDEMGNGLLNKCCLLWDETHIDQLPWPLDKEWIERIIIPDNSNQTNNSKQGLWTEFYNPYSLNKQPMLVGFSGGRIAEQLEDLSDEAIGAQAMQALRDTFAPHTIPDPIQILVTKWGKDEFARGSYSYNAVGTYHRYRARLTDPVNNQLYFAGEACHLQYPSTTQGAFLSGRDAAEQIIKDSNLER